MANTPNLDLVKPAGTDKALVSVINSNSDKIDTGFGSLSDQLGQVKNLQNLGTFTTLSQLSGYLDAAVSSIGQGEIKTFMVACGANVGIFVNTVMYSGHIFRTGGTTYVHAMLYSNSSRVVVSCYRDTNGWHYEQSQSIACVYRNYSDSSQSISYTPLTYNIYLVIVASYGGKTAKAWLVTPYDSSSGGVYTPIASGDVTASISLGANTGIITITTGDYCDVRIYHLPII